MTSNGGANYTYNGESQLATAGGATYTYDGDGNRVKKSSGTLYWGSGPLVESDLSGTASSLKEYIMAGGRRIARRDNVGTGSVFFYLSDNLGSSREIVASGASSACYDADFYPYGGERAYTNTCPQNYKFTGKERDSESGLDNFGARYNSSNLGRFMTPDLVGGHQEDPQTLNRYAYVTNNPTSLTDPTGLDSFLACKDGDKTCENRAVGIDADGNVQWANVQTEKVNGKTVATQIGDDGNGGLKDIATGQAYTGSANRSGMLFSADGGKTSSMGVFINGTSQNTFQDAGWANGGNLSGFQYTLTNSKLEANQTEAGLFFGIGNKNQVERAIEAAGFEYHLLGLDRHFDEYRSPGDPGTGANSGHFNVSQLHQNPKIGVPITPGNMHFGEHNVFTSPLQHIEEQK